MMGLVEVWKKSQMAQLLIGRGVLLVLFFILHYHRNRSISVYTPMALGHSSSPCTNHGGLDGAVPPVGAGARLVVDSGKVDLPHSVRHTASSQK